MKLLPLIIIAVTLATASVNVEAVEFEVTLYLSNNTAVDDGVEYELGPGDFIECRHPWDTVLAISYGWQQIPPLGSDPVDPPTVPPDDPATPTANPTVVTPDPATSEPPPVTPGSGEEIDELYDDLDQEVPGPLFLSFENEPATKYNRLHIAEFLGQGQPTGYRCMAADTDIYNQRANLTGATVYFRFNEASEPRTIGTTFSEIDRIGREGDEISSLTCVRERAIEGRVLIETYNQIGLRQAVIYDSDDFTNGLAEGYSFDNFNGDWDAHPRDQKDFTFSVNMTQETAIFHRCTIQDGGLKIYSQIMLFLVAYENEDVDDCRTEGYVSEGNNAGDVINFGCNVKPYVHPDALLLQDVTVNSYWKMAENDGDYNEVNGTQVLDGESVVSVTAETNTNEQSYVCTVEFHRETGTATRGVIHNACPGDAYTIGVTDQSYGVRLYYGEETIENIVTEDPLVTDKVFNADITCVVYNYPEDPQGETVEIQVKHLRDGEWTSTGEPAVPSHNITEGRQYRCRRERDGDEAFSSEIHIIQRIVETVIHNSEGDQLVDDFYNVSIGDYLECRAAEPDKLTDLYPARFGWQRSIHTPNNMGPYQLTYGMIDTEEYGPVSRMYIDYDMGRGLPIGYQCIGTDDFRNLQLHMAGTLVKFTAVEIPAGEVFDDGDYVGKEDDAIELECTRSYNDARVLWERIYADGNTTVIYDSEGEEEEPILPYEFVDADPGNNGIFSLSIPVSEETAVQTRCTVSAPQGERKYTSVSQTAMIYGVGNILECSSNQGDSADVGDTVRFSGCGATIIVAPNALSMEDELQVVVHWTRTNEDGAEIIEASRVLNTESVYDEVALSEYDGEAYQCGIQISRPDAITNSASISNLCTEPLTLSVAESIRFRTYYGEVTDPNDFLNLRYPTTELAKEATSSLLCEVDRHPPNDDATVTWHKNSDDGWQSLDSVTVDAQDIAVDDEFVCADAASEEDRTNIIRIVSGINDFEAVEIVNSVGVVLDEDTSNSFFEGDYIECRPADQSVTIPVYVWVKSIQIQNLNGPNLIKIANIKETNVNRLPMSYFLGEGEDIAYRCIAGEDFTLGFTERLGRKVVFSVERIDAAAAGTVPLDADYAAPIGDDVTLPCVRHGEEYVLEWWKVTTSGEELLYTTDKPDDNLPQGYQIVQRGDNRFDLTITVQPERATQIRCVVTDPSPMNPKFTVNGTTMVFAVDTDATTCTANGLGVPSNGLGDVVHFSGCTASIVTAEDSGIEPDVYDIIAYWSKRVRSQFESLDDTRVLTIDGRTSEYDMEVSSDDHEALYRCMVEIKRPLEAKSGSTVQDICQDFNVAVTEDDIWYRMYYGPDNSTENQVPFVDDADEGEEEERWFSDGSMVICEAEQHPTGPLPAFVEWKQGNFGNWEETEESEVVGQVDAYYRCFYDTNEPRSATIILSQSADSVPPLGIYYNGELVEEGATLDTLEDEYLECKPLDSVSADLRYVWQKNSDATIEGPIYVNNDNEADGSNRLLLNMNLGAGTTTSYRCTATPAANNATIPEPDGPVANFNVNNVTGSDGQRLEVSLLTLMTVITAYLLNR